MMNGLAETQDHFQLRRKKIEKLDNKRGVDTWPEHQIQESNKRRPCI